MRRGFDGDGVIRTWESWTRDRVESLTQRHVLRSLRPVDAGGRGWSPSGVPRGASSAEVWVSEPTMRAWETGAHDLGDSADVVPANGVRDAFASEAATTRTSFPDGTTSGVVGKTDDDALVHRRLRRLRLFSSNDYLGLGTHPRVRAAAARAAAAHGSGPRSSPLVCGYTVAHRELEKGLASLKNTEECLLFPAGFAANLGVLPSLADGPDCEIFSDRLNHASIVDGCRLASLKGAKVTVYEHNDVCHLESLLMASTKQRKLVVTDALFSVDGDFAPLREIASLKRRLGKDSFFFVIDEAHATLVCGKTGGGAAEMLLKDTQTENDSEDLSHLVDVHVGTLSKAFGSHGGFACCSRSLKSLLLSSSRTQIFSTALPAPCVAAATEALRMAGGHEGVTHGESGKNVDEGSLLRARLWRHVERLRDGLVRGDGGRHTTKPLLHGGRVLNDVVSSPIACVAYGSEEHALKASAALLRLYGLHAPAIRPPTVPLGTSRVRLALSAAHSDEDIDALVEALTTIAEPRL